MKKGQECLGVVEEVLFPNKGIVFVEEQTEEGTKRTKVIVKKTIPGQKVRFRIHKKRKSHCEGMLLEVLEPSKLEKRCGACRNFGACGGCNYQTLPYEAQLDLKAGQVKKLLLDVVEELPFEGINPSPSEWEYRNKMEFTFGDEYKDGPLSLGMHKAGGFYDIVTTKDCKIVHKDYGTILACVLDFFKDSEIPFYHRMSHEGVLRHLLVRRSVSRGEILISLVTTTQMESKLAPMLEGLVERLLALDLQGEICGILHVKNDSLADVVQSDETIILHGKDYFYEELLGLRFKISTFSFFQTNSKGAEVLYNTARQFIEDGCEDGVKGKVVFDLYSGTGTIAQMLAPVAKKVIGVEIVEEAVEAARENAKDNHLENCEFIAGDVLKVLDTIEERPDMIVLDPPRDGIHPKALQKILAYGVDQLLYISCKPTSLARDLLMMQEYGYRVERVKCVDMFPQTVHVETVVLLSKPHDEIKITIETDEFDITPTEAKATYQQIRDFIKEKYNVNVTTLNIAQTKRKYGVEIGEKKPQGQGRVPNCTPEKESMIIEAMKYYQMI
ncbi:MAG: 23S rRNA (uracil(1939)-C(5))-methyltransferase RlmD [Lachnospiraceae bacterium]|nr:23S rRNA (uracil(1939)-C(5))-methyltransferase RlmD [Lachnospiraceae bacterium]